MSEISYQEDPPEMLVTFIKGGRYIYSGVPEDLATQCANAASVGSFLNSEIKPYFQFRRG